MLDDKQKEIKDDLIKINEFVLQERKKEKLTPEQKKGIDYIQERLDLLEKDKSFGGHNQNLDDKMIQDINSKIKELGG
jgi:hypothetical protein